MSYEKKTRTNLANSKKYSHLNDEELFLGIIRAIASANMSWEICKKFSLTVTELRIVKSSVEYTAFKDAYFDDVSESLDYSHKEQLKLFSKYDEIALRELLNIGLESDKEAFKIQALKTYLAHAGVARNQVQDKEYEQLREMVEELTTNQEDEAVA